MNKQLRILTIFALVALYACTSPINNTEQEVEDTKEETLTKAEAVIAESIKAHGGELYETAHFNFNFRGNTYRFRNNGNQFEYEYRGINKAGDSVRTILDENAVKVWINNEPIDLTEKQRIIYSDNLNSVIYFATLPHKLGDASVNKSYEGTATIKGKNYEVIKVTFNQEGGGADFEDEYYYWINKETKLIDYLAYNYQTNGGGVRFRAAYNPSIVGGIHFQDYANYKADVGTALAKLPQLFEADSLEQLSLIETENIVELTK